MAQIEGRMSLQLAPRWRRVALMNFCVCMCVCVCWCVCQCVCECVWDVCVQMHNIICLCVDMAYTWLL